MWGICEIYRQTGRQADRQTDRQTQRDRKKREGERQREVERGEDTDWGGGGLEQEETQRGSGG